MNLEEAMIFELDTIGPLNGKTYPANAPQMGLDGLPVTTPYIVFLSSFGREIRTLAGFTRNKSVNVDLNILTSDYPQLKDLTEQVMSVITSFPRRVIGDGGPFIQDLTYEDPTELYEALPALHRCNISLTFHL
ncbi:hypothetical protein PA598K_01497 [Paenibacillus sp. 598K]|uniref:DUF3168 domain-containing protein n=1 Tax=Paenibacillus sp. 598K TaxID=1117987 RepID=UPI000FFA1A28|nr:DUF3168 domain-containing protein [Paenibacillus sp. 598K]GBF73212.1 hypothetical protein PA598K_01497 [Paenibacillus sp. 598K]